MAVDNSYFRLSQVRRSDAFDDTKTPAQIATSETTSTDHEDFLEFMLSQFKRILHGADAGNWFDNIENSATDFRSLKSLSDDVYFATRLRWRQVLADVAVGASNAYVVLSVGSSEAPSETAAVDNGSAEGAVVKVLAGASGTASLDEVTGINNIQPKNLVLIRDSTTFDPILSSNNRQIYGLLQVETGTVDGDAFNDTDKQVQISFVEQNAAGDDLIQTAGADIGGKTINYQYVSRTTVANQGEQDWLTDVFVDPQSFASNSLQSAYQAGNTIAVTTADGDLIFNLSQDATDFRVQRDGSPFLTMIRDDTGGDVFQVDSDSFDINTTGTPDFNQGIAVDTAGQTVNLGVTTGEIDSTTLRLRATTGDLFLHSNSGDVEFRTVRETTSLPLDDPTAGAISALPGGPYASVSAAIRAALLSADLDVHLQVLQNNYAQDVNVPGSGNSNDQDWSPALDLSSRTISMNSGSIANVDTLILYNGRVTVGGDGTTNNEVYVGDTAANGDLKWNFSKGVKTNDVVMALVFAAV